MANGEVKLWDLGTRKERATLKSDLGESYRLAFAPDGQTLAVAYIRRDAKTDTLAGGIVLWDTATGKERGRLQENTPRGVIEVVFSPDGRTLASCEHSTQGKKEVVERIVLWDLAGGKVRATFALDNASGLAFSPDGKVLVASTLLHDGKRWLGSKVRRWDVATGKELPALHNPPEIKGSSASLVFSPDGRTLAGGDYQGKIIVWDVVKGAVRTTLSHK